MKRHIAVLSLIAIVFFSFYSLMYAINTANRADENNRKIAVIEKMFAPDGAYDYNNLLASPIDIEAVQKSMVWLVTRTKLEVTRAWGEYTGKNEVEKIFIGGGFVATLPQGFPKGKYIFTLDHLVSQNEFIVRMSPFSRPMNMAKKKISEKTYLFYDNKEVEIEELINDELADFALYKLPEDINIESFPYAFGNSDELKSDNVVRLLGRPENFAEISLRRGVIANPKGWLFPDFFEKYEKFKNSQKELGERILRRGNYSPDNMFQITAGINPGDSAGVVVCFRDGVPELVGMGQCAMPARQKMGMALKINFILDIIKNFFSLAPARP